MANYWTATAMATPVSSAHNSRSPTPEPYMDRWALRGQSGLHRMERWEMVTRQGWAETHTEFWEDRVEPSAYVSRGNTPEPWRDQVASQSPDGWAGMTIWCASGSNDYYPYNPRLHEHIPPNQWAEGINSPTFMQSSTIFPLRPVPLPSVSDWSDDWIPDEAPQAPAPERTEEGLWLVYDDDGNGLEVEVIDGAGNDDLVGFIQEWQAHLGRNLSINELNMADALYGISRNMNED